MSRFLSLKTKLNRSVSIKPVEVAISKDSKPSGTRIQVHKCILYFHLFAFPIMAFVLMLGRDFYKLYNDGYHSLLLDNLYFGLCIVIIGSLMITTISSMYLIPKSFKKVCYKSLHIYTVIYFVSIAFNNTIFTWKDYINAQKEGRPTKNAFFIVFNMIYVLLYMLNGFVLLVRRECLRTKNGFPIRRSFSKISLKILVFINLIPLSVVSFLVYGLFSQETLKLKGKGILYKQVSPEFVKMMYIGHVISFALNGLNAVFLLIGVIKRNTFLLKSHLAVVVIQEIYFGLSWNTTFFYLAIDKEEAVHPIFRLFTVVTSEFGQTFGCYLVYCLIKSFSSDEVKPTKNKITLKIPEKVINRFLKSEKVPWIRVQIDVNDERLGRGYFAEVRKGKIQENKLLLRIGTDVAVKTILGCRDFDKENSNKFFDAVLSEIKVLNRLRNYRDNLVKFYGVTRYEGALGIVMEYCCGGSLEKYLREIRKSPKFPESVDSSKLLKLHLWAEQIASACEFLGFKKIVHGDLATRNVILDKHDNAKVTDFGSSINLYTYQYIRSMQSAIPWRWMAPEVLSDHKFSQASDSWSYGVLLWELYTFGEIPWKGFEWTSDFVANLMAGQVLEKPFFASEDIYENVICGCMRVLEFTRITFTDIATFFSTLNPTTKLCEQIQIHT